MLWLCLGVDVGRYQPARRLIPVLCARALAPQHLARLLVHMLPHSRQLVQVSALGCRGLRGVL